MLRVHQVVRRCAVRQVDVVDDTETHERFERAIDGCSVGAGLGDGQPLGDVVRPEVLVARGQLNAATRPARGARRPVRSMAALRSPIPMAATAPAPAPMDVVASKNPSGTCIGPDASGVRAQMRHSCI